MSSQGKYKVEKKDPLKAFLPIIGLIIIIIAGVVGWFSSPYILQFGCDFIPTEVTSQIDAQTLRIIVSVVVFAVIIALFSMVYAIFAPKPPRAVSERALQKQRIEIEAERKRTKARKIKMRRRMKEGNKSIDDI